MRNIHKVFIAFLLVLVSVLPFAQSHLVEAASAYEDGEYSLPFTVLKGDSDESSMTNDYLTSPATLIVKDGKNIVQVTLKNSSWWKEFTVVSSDVTVLSEANDTRVVQFEVADLDSILQSKIHVVVPDIDYDNKYDVRFSFDASGIPVKDVSEGANNEKANDKESENTEGDDTTTGGNAEENPPTGDETPILLFTIILLGSGLFLVRKLATKRRTI